MRIVVSFMVEQAKNLPLPFLAKEGKTTSVAIFVHWLVYTGTTNSSGMNHGVQLTWVSVPRGTTSSLECTTGYN